MALPVKGANGKRRRPLANEETHVADMVDRVKAELATRDGPGPLSAAQSNLVDQIRRASERDRIAAKLLREGQDLKGGPLSHDQQVEQREIQATALRCIETCLGKLGLDDRDQAANSDPMAKLASHFATPPNAAGTLGRFSVADSPPEPAHVANVDCAQPEKASGPDSDLTDHSDPAEALP